MSKTSSAAKSRYNAKAYEQILLRVMLGKKSVIQARAFALDMSVNGYITYLINQDLNRST